MLSEEVRRLLTACVDGELTNRQRKAVARLLRRSPEARALLRKLQGDAERLRALPRPRLGDDFTARVVRALRLRQAQQRRAAARPSHFPTWAGLSAAAVVLLAVSLGSFFYFAQATGDDTAGPALALNDRQHPADPAREPATEAGKEDRADGGAAATRPQAPDKPSQVAQPEPLPTMPEEIAIAARPTDPGKPAVAGAEAVVTGETPRADMEMFKPSRVKPLFTLIAEVRDIQADKLRKEIAQETALRVELPCHDTARGFRRLQTALQGVGIALVIDQAAQRRLERPLLRSNYVVFVEDLTGEELARALARVGSDDKKAAAAKPKPDGQFSKMVLNRLSDADRTELSAVLHVEPRQLQTSPDKPGKVTERLALAVTYNPERPKPNSAEVKRYLESRKPARPGAIQVLLVLRETPG
jgi:hypothetical protein